MSTTTTTTTHHPMSLGFVCSEERIEAVQRRPTPTEQRQIHDYVCRYAAAFQRAPHGLHYLPAIGPVWIPPESGSEFADPIDAATAQTDPGVHAG